MNKYIIELLKIQSSIILPGFGSLVITSRKTGKITFNALLKFNDGALAKYISEKEGIDQQAAQNQIAKFVREIEADLGKGNSFDIFQLGKFVKNEKDEITFVQDEKSISVMSEITTSQKPVAVTSTTKTESKPVEKPKEEPKKTETKTSEKPIKESSLEDKLKSAESKTELPKNTFTPNVETKKEEIKSDVKSEISKNIPVADASKKETPAQDKNVFKPSDDKPKAEEKKVEAKPKVEEKKVEVKAKTEDKKEDKSTTDKTSNSQQSIKEKFKKDKPQKIKHKDPEAGGKKPKKKKRVVLWVIIIIILGGGGTAGYLFKDEINNFLHQGVGEHDSDSTHHDTSHHDSLSTDSHLEENSLQEDSLMSENNTEEVVHEEVDHHDEPVKTEPIKTQPVVNHNTGSNGSYHIIGNAFSSESNAENYVAKMKEKGYPAQNIGKHNGLYLVSLKSFSTKEEAKSNLSSVKSDAEGAYVFTKK